MPKSSVFVLLATFDPDPDPIPNEIWVFTHQAKAENFFRGWSEDFLDGYSHDVNGPLRAAAPDAELVAAFRNMGAHVHLYECHLNGVGVDELVPFEALPDHYGAARKGGAFLVSTGDTTMKQQMEAELMFDHPDGRDLAVAELTKQGYAVEILDWVDDYEGVLLTPTVWIKVRGPYEGNAHEFFDEMGHLAGQCSGEVIEAGQL